MVLPPEPPGLRLGFRDDVFCDSVPLPNILPTVLGPLPGFRDLLPDGVPAKNSAHRALQEFAAPQVVFALIDGMGWHPLSQRLAHAPFLRSLVAKPGVQLPAVSVCPSTTAAAITSALTGRYPGDHNMMSYALWERGASESFNLINFRGATVSAQDFQPLPTMFEMLSEVGLDSVALGPARFIGHGLTLAALRGARYVSSEDISTRVQHALEAVRSGSTLTYFYISDLDHAGHHRGWASTKWAEELEQVDRALATLAAGLPAGVLLIVTADHGMVDAQPERMIDIATLPQVCPLVVIAAGEGRACHLYAPPGRQQDLLAALREQLPADHHWVLSRPQMVELFRHWGGGGTPRADLLGDAVVFSSDNWQVVDSRYYAPGAMQMLGVHGSLTVQELEIPLFCYKN